MIHSTPRIFIEGRGVGTDSSLGHLVNPVRHAYLTFQIEDGSTYVISGGPQYMRKLSENPLNLIDLHGNIVIEAGVPLDQSDNVRANNDQARNEQGAVQIAVDNVHLHLLWARMIRLAREIQETVIDYDSLGPNGNTVIAAILDKLGLQIAWPVLSEDSLALVSPRSFVKGYPGSDQNITSALLEKVTTKFPDYGMLHLGTSGRDWLYGGIGDDLLVGNAGDDYLFGGADNDLIFGGSGADLIHGGTGIDTAIYTDARRMKNDSLINGVFVDLATGEGHLGDAQGDRLLNIENVMGSRYNDAINGDDGNNKLDGGDGNDVISGRLGDDLLIGGQGNDRLNGGSGQDILEGGAGQDVFEFLDHRHDISAIAMAGGLKGLLAAADRVRDFTAGEDLLQFSRFATKVVQRFMTDADGARGSLLLIVGERDLINFVFLEGYTAPLRQSDLKDAGIAVEVIDFAPGFRDANGRPINSQTVQVNENVAGAILTGFNVVDPDGDGPVRYEVMSHQDQFMIEDGKLRLKPGVALDYESLPHARIVVEVSATTIQTGARPMVTKMNVTVEVVNVDGQGKGEPDTYERPVQSTPMEWQDLADLQLSARLADFEPHLDRLNYDFSQSTVLYRVVGDPLAEGGKSTQVIVASFPRGVVVDNVLLEGVSDPITSRNIHNPTFPIKHLVLGTNGDDRYDSSLDGTPHDDYIVGLQGRDQLDGRGGDDILDGGSGNDELDGGAGKDEFYGGAGADQFDVSDVAGSIRQADIIHDFSRSDGDKLRVGDRSNVLYKQEDVNRDGLTDTVLYRYVEEYNRSNPAEHGVYAILMDFALDLEHQDFVHEGLAPIEI